MFRVPDSAWLTSSRVDSRLVSLATFPSAVARRTTFLCDRPTAATGRGVVDPTFLSDTSITPTPLSFFSNGMTRRFADLGRFSCMVDARLSGLHLARQRKHAASSRRPCHPAAHVRIPHVARAL